MYAKQEKIIQTTPLLGAFVNKGVDEALEIRKNCERPFNLLKNQTGLEKLRVRSQHATISRCTFATIAVLLIKMAGKRKKRKLQKNPSTY